MTQLIYKTKSKRMIVLLLLLCAVPLGAAAQNACNTPQELGEFIRNCSLFITWPSGSEASDKTKPLTLGVIGSKEDFKYLEKAFETISTNEKKIMVRYFASAEELGNCHILFISKSAEDKIPQILSFTKNKAILTIGKTKGFCEMGIHINLVSFSSPIIFEVNQNAILAAGLKVSHILMSHARIVNR